MYFIRLLFIIILSTNLFSNVIEVSKDLEKKSILHQTKIFVDETQKLTINDIKNQNRTFTNIDENILRYGYSPKFNVWIKLDLKNIEKEKLNLILEFESPLTSNVEFYKNYTLITTDGLLDEKTNRRSLHPTFNIDLQGEQTQSYYLKVSSHITSMTVKLNLYTNKTFYENELQMQVYFSLFFGAMLVLALYNLSIYFFTKDISYLFYVGYIFTIVMHHLLYVGFAKTYLLNYEQMSFVVKIAPVFIALPVLFLTLFSKSFLNIKNFKTINKILNIFLILLPISVIFFIINDSFGKFRNIIPIVLMCYLFFITVYTFFKGEKQANLILLGWGIILFAGLVMYFSSAGILNIDLSNYYIIEISFVSEALIFSMALANKINRFQEEKQQAQDRLIEEQRNTQKRLQKLVESKTKDLKKTLDEKELLLKELNHRVKNNMQTIISLIRLQNDEIDDKKINNLLLTIQNRISAMSHLHQLLYKKDNTTYIDAYDYFERIVSEIKDSYEDEDIDIVFDINTHLNPNGAVYCGLILNELITNSFKHAFVEKEGVIEISLFKKNNLYNLIVKDNGKGYNQNIKTNSLGLVLIKTLATKQLGAKIDIDSLEGVEVKIVWSEKNEY